MIRVYITFLTFILVQMHFQRYLEKVVYLHTHRWENKKTEVELIQKSKHKTLYAIPCWWLKYTQFNSSRFNGSLLLFETETWINIKVQCLSSLAAFKVFGILVQYQIFKFKTGFFSIPVTCVVPFKYALANNKTVLNFDLKRNVIDQ